MERYLIFAGFDFYPKGGMKDYFRSASSIEEAYEVVRIALTDKVILDQSGFDVLVPAEWAHAYDTEMMKVVVDSEKRDLNDYGQVTDYKEYPQ